MIIKRKLEVNFYGYCFYFNVYCCYSEYGKPIPADNYYSWYSEEIAESIIETAVANEYYPHLDFDDVLSVIDAVSVRKRYIYNVLNGNTMHFGESDIMEIVAENFKPEEYNEYFYYEIDFVNGECCRAYELDFSETTYIHVYMEMNEKRLILAF